MLINFKYSVKESDIQGKGLFTEEDIQKGQPIWVKSDREIFVQVDSIPYHLRDYWDKYATVQKYGSVLMYLMDSDECKFMNHSMHPNVVFHENFGYANEFIPKGTELTCDYSEITTPEHFEYLMINN